MSSSLPEFLEHIVAKDTKVSVHDLVLDGTKVGFWPERIAAWQRGEKIAPVTIDASWTRKCQASCHFCYAQLQSNNGSGEITKQNAFDFLSDAAEIGVRGISLISDGESSMVPWYAESIEHGAKCGLAIGIGSNGVALRRPVLERILPHLSYLRFNFSAGEQKRYAEIMGLRQAVFDVVKQNIRDAMEIVRRDQLSVTVNMQMVCHPKDADQILPFARLVRELSPSYGILKHCADSRERDLGVNYGDYTAMHDLFREAEAMGDSELRIVAKWQKIQNDGKRQYTRCFGPPFICQLSGSGLFAPCGMLFNERFRAFHIGWITKQRFRDIWASDRYKEVMDYLAGDHFNPQDRCGAQCLQDRVNDYLYRYVNGQVELPTTTPPPHLEFI